MANLLGRVVRSPRSFQVTWSGNWKRPPAIKVLDGSGVVMEALIEAW